MALDEVQLSASAARRHYETLAAQGWESAIPVVSSADWDGLGTLEAYRVRKSTMAGVYAARRDSPDQQYRTTVDLEEFVRSVDLHDGEFVYFFSLVSAGFTSVCAISANLEQPVACTAVRSEYPDPFTQATGEIATLPRQDAVAILCHLEGAGWESARVAIQGLIEGTRASVPVWLANPQTLCNEFRRFVLSQSAFSQASKAIDAEKFFEVMVRQNTEKGRLCIFHVVDMYGWQVTCVIRPNDMAGVACVGVRRT